MMSDLEQTDLARSHALSAELETWEAKIAQSRIWSNGWRREEQHGMSLLLKMQKIKQK